jgi:hypothetical protein
VTDSDLTTEKVARSIVLDALSNVAPPSKAETAQQLREVFVQLAKLPQMSDEECEKRIRHEHADRLRDFSQFEDARAEKLQVIETLIQRAEAWQIAADADELQEIRFVALSGFRSAHAKTLNMVNPHDLSEPKMETPAEWRARMGQELLRLKAFLEAEIQATDEHEAYAALVQRQLEESLRHEEDDHPEPRRHEDEAAPHPEG